MYIFVTGDLHGTLGVERLYDDNFPQGKLLTKDDYLVILGDFGFVWDGSEDENQWLDWLNNRNYTVLFIDGNHENFDMLNSLPVEIWNEGKVHRIRENVIHLMRGQVFNINGVKIFTFGGARSTDREYRTEYISWWKDEIPSYSECEEGLSNLEKNNWKVDYIFTHTCSREMIPDIEEYISIIGLVDPTNKYLQILEDKCIFRHWYFGHFHIDVPNIYHKHSVLYKDIIKCV